MRGRGTQGCREPEKGTVGPGQWKSQSCQDLRAKVLRCPKPVNITLDAVKG